MMGLRVSARAVLTLTTAVFCLPVLGVGDPKQGFQITVSPSGSVEAAKSYSPNDPGPDYPGLLVYANENARYTAAGFKWPWDNTLVVHQLGGGDTPPQSYKVATRPYDFVFDPQVLSPESILFKVGDPYSSDATYRLVHWRRDKQANHVRLLTSHLTWRLVQASPTGRFVSYISQERQGAALCTFDLTAGVEKHWGEGEPLLGSVSWTPDNTLLYSLLPTPKEARTGRPAEKAPATSQKEQSPNAISSAWRPDVYEVDPLTGDTKTIIRGGIRALVSPDNQWTAYFSFNGSQSGSEPSAAQKDRAPDKSPVVRNGTTLPSLSLVLSRRDGKDVRVIRPEPSEPSQMLWVPSSSSLLICTRQWRAATASARAMVDRYDLANGRISRVATILYSTPPGTDLTEDDRLWRPLRITRDGRYLLFELMLFGAPPSNGTVLKALDLATGNEHVWARAATVCHLDWRENSAEAPQNR